MKNKIFTLVLLVSVFLSTQVYAAAPPSGTQADNNWWGEGNYDISWYNADNILDEYTFTTAAELAGLSYLINGTGAGSASGIESKLRNKIFKLGADIDLSAHYWVAIGHGQNSFGGWFDGQGHTITGLYMDFSGDQYAYEGTAANIHQGAAAGGTGNMAGLFGRVNNQNAGSYIKNIVLGEGLIKTHPSNYTAGALIAFNNRNANLTVSNIINLGVEVIGGSHVGGLIGFSNNGVVYHNLANLAPVTVAYSSAVLPDAAVYGGGIMGGSQSVATLNNSYNAGTVNVTSGSTNLFIGGLIGEIGTTTVPIAAVAPDNLTGDNNYYLSGTYKDLGNGDGSDFFIASAKTVDDMKTAAFVTTLNVNNMGDEWVKKAGCDFPVFGNTNITTGIQSPTAASASLKVYAANGVVFISALETGRVEVYNLTGQVVASSTQPVSQIALPKGIYMIKFAGNVQKVLNQ